MATNVQDTLRELLISTLEQAGKNAGGDSDKSPSPPSKGGSGHRGLAAGVGLAALAAPFAAKGLGRLAQQAGMDGVKDLAKSPGDAVKGLGAAAGGQAGSKLADKASDKVDEAGGVSGIVGDAVKGALPFGGGGGGGKGGGLGVGKGRRMPVQQSIDIAAPIETVYNQWTQFEDWPSFMHRVVRATQDDDCTVTFEAKIWTRTREFTANIETQRPNERIKWKVGKGITHAGVVSFHELGPNLTRVLLAIDVQPGGMIEKMARGMRHVKRASRGDLHRFKAFIEMAEQESGAWRGVIEDGEVVEEHDPDYDKGREYSDPEEVLEQDEDSEDSDEDEGKDKASQDQDDDSGSDEDGDEEKPRAARRRRSQSSNGSGSGDDSESEKPSTRSRSSSGSSASGSSSRGGSRRKSRSSGSGNGGSSSSGSSRSSGGSRSGGSRSKGGSGTSGGSSSSPRSRSRSSNN